MKKIKESESTKHLRKHCWKCNHQEVSFDHWPCLNCIYGLPKKQNHFSRKIEVCEKKDCRWKNECGIKFGSKFCDYEKFTEEELADQQHAWNE